MTPHQKTFTAWRKQFCESCIAHGGTQMGFGCVEQFEFDTPEHGKLTASIHESDYESQKKRHLVQIYMRFKTFSTGKVYDQLMGFDFNGWSGKWNIMVSGGVLSQVMEAALCQLEARLEFILQKQIPK